MLSWLVHGYHGWHMDALRERMESDLDVIMVGTWMLCGEWRESDLDVIMVRTWMICVNGWSLIWP